MTSSFRAGALTRRTLLGGFAATACASRLSAEDKGPSGILAKPEPIEIRARLLPYFQSGKPDNRRFGDLEYRGGLVLSSPAEHFGGWSGLVMDPDGKRFVAVSDRKSVV